MPSFSRIAKSIVFGSLVCITLPACGGTYSAPPGEVVDNDKPVQRIDPQEVAGIAEELKAARTATGNEHLRVDLDQLDGLSDDQFLARIQFDYLRYYLTHKTSPARTEIDGYVVNLFVVASHNGWMSREQAATGVLEYLRDYERAETANGILPRLFDRKSGQRIAGQPYDVVGTAFLTASVQYVIRQFFDGSDADEVEIRRLCNLLIDRVDWDYAYDTGNQAFTWFKDGSNPARPSGKVLKGELDETFFLQFLVLTSKNWSHGLESYEAYIEAMPWDEFYGYGFFSTREPEYKRSEQFTGINVLNPKHELLEDYPTAKLGYLLQTHTWFKLRGFQDHVTRAKGIDYFSNTYNAIQAQIAYAKQNPANHPYYGAVWGFYDTYSPISRKWMITGLPAEGDTDEGTVSISAVLSSIPIAPEDSIHCLRTLYKEFNQLGIYTPRGFVMSVNTRTGEVASTPDEFFAPINVLSIENHRSGLLWRLAEKAPEYHQLFSTLRDTGRRP